MIDEVKQKVEKLIGLELIPVFDSREDEGCEDEEYGHYVSFEPNLGMELEYPPIVNIYEGGRIQFYHDATPYPVLANTEEESRWMMMTLCPAPVEFSDIRDDDFNNFINLILNDQ
jgi:hypothetical protein